MRDILKQFGKRTRELRVEKDWSQEEFALKSGMDRSYIGGVERGERNITLTTLYRIAEALDLHPSELLKKRTTEG